MVVNGLMGNKHILRLSNSYRTVRGNFEKQDKQQMKSKLTKIKENVTVHIENIIRKEYH